MENASSEAIDIELHFLKIFYIYRIYYLYNSIAFYFTDQVLQHVRLPITAIPDLPWVWRMSRLTRHGTAEPVSRDQILRRERGQGKVHFPRSADHEQNWQPYPVNPYSAICDDHTCIHTYIDHGDNLHTCIHAYIHTYIHTYVHTLHPERAPSHFPHVLIQLHLLIIT